MPPPANNSAATATVIGALPYSNVQSDIHDAGTTSVVWYVWTATFTGGLGVFGYGDAVVYRPGLEVFTGPDPGTLSEHPAGTFIYAENLPVQIPVVLGEDYYFSFSPQGGNPNPAVLTLSVLAGPVEVVAEGSLFVNDDKPNFPAVILSAVDGSILRFLSITAAGESAFINRATGDFILEDKTDDSLKIYDSAFALVATLTSVFPISVGFITGNMIDRFYYAIDMVITEVFLDGSIGDTWDVTAGGVTAYTIAVSRDDAILYYAPATGDAAIKRWDLVNGVPLSDLAAGIGASYNVSRQMLVLADGTLLVLYISAAPLDAVVYHYSAAGAVLDTYDVSAGILAGQNGDNQIAHALDDPASFWAWMRLADGISEFTNIRISDGAELAQFQSVQYEEGVYQGVETDTPSARFGHSESCPFFVLGDVVVGSPGSTGGEPGNPPDGIIGPIAWVEEWEDDD